MKNIKKTLGITAIAALTLGAGAVAIAPNVNNNDISVHNESSVTTENITQFDFEDTPFTINISEQVSTGEFADAGAYDMEIAVEIEHIEGEQAQVMNELNIRTRMYNGTATSTQLIDATTNNTILDMSSDDDLGLENILTETTQLFRYEEMIIRIDGDYTYTDSMDDLHEDVEFDFELNYDNSTMALGVDQANNKMIRKVSPVLDYDYDDQTDLLTLNGEVKLISNSGWGDEMFGEHSHKHGTIHGGSGGNNDGFGLWANTSAVIKFNDGSKENYVLPGIGIDTYYLNWGHTVENEIDGGSITLEQYRHGSNQVTITLDNWEKPWGFVQEETDIDYIVLAPTVTVSQFENDVQTLQLHSGHILDYVAPSNGGLSAGAITGIVIGSIAGATLLGAGSFYIWKSKQA